MDNFVFNCSHCRHDLKLPLDVAKPGDYIECPACRQEILVPDIPPQTQPKISKTTYPDGRKGSL